MTKLDPATQNALDIFKAILGQYGLDSLANYALKFIQAGNTPENTMTLLTQTDAWKQRFAGNEERIKAGLPALGPAAYLDVERQYKDIMAAYGMPKGFYDKPDDFVHLIGHDISPDELQDRVKLAHQFSQQDHPEFRQALAQYGYPTDASSVAAYFLDPAKAQSAIDRTGSAIQLGAYAIQNHVKDFDKDLALKYGGLGMTEDAMQQGMAKIGQSQESMEQIASRFGQTWSTQDAADQYLGGLASAQRKSNQLQQSEEALFGTGTGIGSKSVASAGLGDY